MHNKQDDFSLRWIQQIYDSETDRNWRTLTQIEELRWCFLHVFEWYYHYSVM
jgi:hypothetical protein